MSHCLSADFTFMKIKYYNFYKKVTRNPYMIIVERRSVDIIAWSTGRQWRHRRVARWRHWRIGHVTAVSQRHLVSGGRRGGGRRWGRLGMTWRRTRRGVGRVESLRRRRRWTVVDIATRLHTFWWRHQLRPSTQTMQNVVLSWGTPTDERNLREQF